MPQKAPLRLLLLLPLAGLVLTLLAGWPGGVTPDAGTSIREGIYFRFQGHQQPVLGLLWAGALKLFAVATIVKASFVAQSAAYWFGFGLFTHTALRRGSPVVAAIAALGGLLPPLLDFVGTVESNMQVGIVWFLALAIGFSRTGARWLLATLPLVFYGFVVRSGMIVAMVPLLFALLLLHRLGLTRIKAAAGALGIAAGFWLTTTLITRLWLGAPTREQVLAVSQIFDISAVYQRTGTQCLPAALIPPATSAEAVLREFTMWSVSSVIWSNSAGGVKLPTSEAEFAGLRACWVQTLREHPGAYLRAKLRFALLFLMVGERWAPAIEPDHSANPEFGLRVPGNSATRLIHHYVERTRAWLLWRGWFWLLLGAAATGLALWLKAEARAVVLAVYLAALGTLVPHFLLGQAALSRYFFLPYILIVAALLVFAGSLRPVTGAPLS